MAALETKSVHAMTYYYDTLYSSDSAWETVCKLSQAYQHGTNCVVSVCTSLKIIMHPTRLLLNHVAAKHLKPDKCKCIPLYNLRVGVHRAL